MDAEIQFCHHMIYCIFKQINVALVCIRDKNIQTNLTDHKVLYTRLLLNFSLFYEGHIKTALEGRHLGCGECVCVCVCVCACLGLKVLGTEYF